MADILLILILLAIIWIWWDNMQAKEAARQAARHACDRVDVQFLDDTVESKKIWLRRNSRGTLEICRLFFFEFSSDGSRRYQGRVIVLGKRISEVDMDAYRI